MIFDLDTRWLWKGGIGKVRLTIRESQVLRDLLMDAPMPEGWHESRNVHQYVHALRQKGIKITTRHGYVVTDDIEMIGD